MEQQGRRRKRKAGNVTAGDRVADGLIPSGAASAPPHEDAVDGEQIAAATNAAAARPASASSGWGVIVGDVRGIDVGSTYRRLYDALVLGEGVTEYGAILHALDGADRNIVDSERLVRAAKLEQERVDRIVATELEVLRTTAARELEADKAKGLRSKAPTIQDIEDRITANWPTKVSEVKTASEEIHAVRSVCEKLETAWRSRAQTLRAMADRYAPRRDPIIGGHATHHA